MNYMIVVVVTILIINAVFSALFIVTPSLENIAWNSFLAIVVLLLTEKRRRECYAYYDYDYDRENPNALVTGENIAGTVFASYPDETPGLGWVL